MSLLWLLLYVMATTLLCEAVMATTLLYEASLTTWDHLQYVEQSYTHNNFEVSICIYNLMTERQFSLWDSTCTMPTCMYYAWYIHDTGRWSLYAWYMYLTYMKHSCYSKHAWRLHGTYMHNISSWETTI